METIPSFARGCDPRPMRGGSRAATLAALAFVLASTVSATASAQEAIAETIAAEDVLRMTDGTTLRGHVVLTHPGCDLTIILEDGASHTVPWAHVANMVGPAFTMGPRAPSGPHHDDETDFLLPGPGRVELDVTSTGENMVLGLYNGFTSRRQICLTPCTLYVRPRLLTLTADGLHVRHTETRIEVPESGLHVHLRAPSSGIEAAGVVLNLVGGFAIAGGGLMTAFGATGSRVALTGLGIGTAVLGGVLVLTGTVVLARTQRSGIASDRPSGVTARRNQTHVRFGAFATHEGFVIAGGAVF